MLRAWTRFMILAVIASVSLTAMADVTADAAQAMTGPADNKIPKQIEPLHLEGRIGRKLPISMDLQFIWGQDAARRWTLEVEGVYFYHKYHKDIFIRGTRDGEKMRLSEYDDSRALIGEFVGSLVSNTSFRGIWTSQDGSRELPFELHVGEYRIGKTKSLRVDNSSKSSDFIDEWNLERCADEVPLGDKCEGLRATALCRYQIHEGLPEYYFSLEFDRYFQVRILVSRGKQHEFVQSLFAPILVGFPGGADFKLLEPLDMNFDGFKDIRLYYDYPPSGNYSCRVWLFDPAKNRFVLSNALGKLSAAVFNPETRTVDWHWKVGAAERTGGVSRVDQDGKVTPINELHRRWSEDKKIILEIKKEFRNGEMVVVSEKAMD